MIFFPRRDDTTDLKILINKGAFDYEGKNGNLREGTIRRLAGKKGQGYSYEWDFTYDKFYFDRDYIYVNDEEISLADLLVNKIIMCRDWDSEIADIVTKRGLKYEKVHTGYTTTDVYMGESFGSTDHDLWSYLITKE